MTDKPSGLVVAAIPAANDAGFESGESQSLASYLAGVEQAELVMLQERRRHEVRLAARNLPKKLRLAEEGDTKEARESLEWIAALLDCSYIDPTTAEPWPVPPFVRDYLVQVLRRIVAGERPEVALNLKGRPRTWRHFQKLHGAGTVDLFVKQGLTIAEATSKASELIREIELRPGPAGRAFDGRHVSPETLQTWYYELRDQLQDYWDL